ncbi:Phosphoglycerate mutase OS=Tsukamurella paurometabola (strain ATCC 8368 / DSM / CCUG 35730 /CIP 100753 / JCM 10117 / KCTC 9821 / NBRC 16120 / NCIMB 702349/ NCTC 13040) OX=521096 GN=Tpau_0146 PE=4 SV=1 [Tsukamurella paurometabola]|uniref:Phosphoglycerate mutase n=1 Tax=Tsukamurella paurometabola (strain ATCC 8368 / DSM 20162 / CCUG 35730 / CIP 100753 / JCM 10117 / KCTC 9821 / NBRC 16120 / NCIMB 702349 / NCTC 13040) TaxID=521096 RepID=D5UQ32_TSUPD|nr:histidine phosphatase family protein [Tsukamurella paurometabola]ADG76800.1 Phosphoglycerate mutase [Tsukamurella paurometabola DSM 20162]SUP41689.1 Alpha-ribazole phosphatase [Tsukamurella paurometabola]
MTGLLHLVRHGQTTANVAKALDTLPPGAPLTAEGSDQARRFAADRPGTVPAVLLSSVARRAQQTAELIGAGWNVPVTVIDGVHEVQAGDLEGRTDEEAVRQFRDVVERWHSGDRAAALPGGESADDLFARYLPAVAAVRAQYLDAGDVYLVSHGAAIRLVAAQLGGVDGEYAHKHHLPNTGEIVLRPLPGPTGGWELVSWADAPSPADPMG